MKLMAPTFEALQVRRPPGIVCGVCLDKGYDSAQIRTWLRKHRYVPHVRSRGEEACELKRGRGFRARRWVVERTNSWVNRFRRILIRWEKLEDTFMAMLHLACGIITWRSTDLLK
jgi:putative transposase